MRVWKREDWLWRLAAIAGLAQALSAVYAIMIEGAYFSIWDAPPASGPHAGGIAGAIALSLFVVCWWLPMLRWRRAVWIWVPLCAESLLVSPWIFSYLVLGVIALLASQVWIVWEAHVAVGRLSEAKGLSLACGRLHAWRQAGWIWRAFAVVGAAAGLSLAASVVYLSNILIEPSLGLLGYGDPPYVVRIVSHVAQTTAAMALAGVIVLAWISLLSTGRGFRFWLLLWGLGLLIYCWVAGSLYLTGGAPDSHIFFGLIIAFPLLAASQIWVAWKSHQLATPAT